MPSFIHSFILVYLCCNGGTHNMLHTRKYIREYIRGIWTCHIRLTLLIPYRTVQYHTVLYTILYHIPYSNKARYPQRAACRRTHLSHLRRPTSSSAFLIWVGGKVGLLVSARLIIFCRRSASTLSPVDRLRAKYEALWLKLLRMGGCCCHCSCCLDDDDDDDARGDGACCQEPAACPEMGRP